MPVRSSRSPLCPAGVRSLFRRAARAALTLALVAGGGWLAVPARADIQAPMEAHTIGERLQRRGQQSPRQPPNAVAQEVEIHQGETIEIVLQGRGQAGKSLEFTVRTPPAHGTLEGPPRQLTRNTAAVTYIHRAEDGPGGDSFTFSVQATGSAKSAPSAVTVNVLDAPPSLAASPAELDFGAVKAGETTRASVTLENRGGGLATGTVEPPPPWTVDGPADYRLAHGASQTFALVFQPSYGRSYVETVHFRPEDGRGVRLIGTGIGPRDPSEDGGPGGSSLVSVNPMADVIARNNALALAAENAAATGATRPDGAGPAGTPPRVAGATPAASGDHAGAPPVDGASSRPPAALAAAPDGEPGGNGSAATVAPGGPDSVIVNTAAVKVVELRGAGTSTLDLAWKPPRPTPKSYRVELRYLSLSNDDSLAVDWRPYARTDIRVTDNLVTARISGLPAGTRQTLRVVAVDDAGRLAPASGTLVATTRLAATWWQVTPLKVLVVLLLGCLGLLIYRKWEERQILRDLDERRERREAEVSGRI